jgi:hypothetical protein
MTRIRGRKRLDLIEEFAIVAQYHTVPFARRDRKGFFYSGLGRVLGRPIRRGAKDSGAQPAASG